MSSLFSLWRTSEGEQQQQSRRRRARQINEHEDELSPTQSAVWQPQQTEQRDEEPAGNNPGDGDDSNNNQHRNTVLEVSVRREPVTPEALRTRLSVSALRRELQLEETLLLQHQQQQQQHLHQRQPSFGSATGTPAARPFLVEKKPAPAAQGLLPPAPSSSWSIPQQQQQLHHLAAPSPPITSNGFYMTTAGAKGTNPMSTAGAMAPGVGGIAESPALLPGRAKTAVGALVAKQQQHSQPHYYQGITRTHSNDHGSSGNHPPLLAAASSASTTGYEADADGSAVVGGAGTASAMPPFGLEEEHQELYYSSWGQHQKQQPQQQLPKQPLQQQPKPAQQPTALHDESRYTEVYEDDEPYYPLVDSHEISSNNHQFINQEPTKEEKPKNEPHVVHHHQKPSHTPRPAKQPKSQEEQQQKEQAIRYYISPMTANSSFAQQASPSTLARKVLDHSFMVHSSNSVVGHRFVEPPQDRNDHNHHSNDVSMSSSRAGLLGNEQRDGGDGQARGEAAARRYDFGSVHDTSHNLIGMTEVVWATHPSDQTHISAMSLSVPDTTKSHAGEQASATGGGAGGVHEDTFVNDSLVFDEEGNAVAPNSAVEGGMDDSLVSQKARNQRRSREDLLVAAVERLQDDMDLVSQVEAVGNAVTKEMGDWFVQTDTTQEGFLTGFSIDNRKALSQRLTSILEEMNGAAQPEDFFIMSPTQAAAFSETHSDLYQALYFCRSLVQMAIPAGEQAKNDSLQDPNFQGKWQIDKHLKQAMNLSKAGGGGAAAMEMASPFPSSRTQQRVGGGDTSIFTLPSESVDTPMTSNLSVSTVHKDWPSQKKLLAESHQVQRTVELLSTLLEKLSRACRKWLESSSTGSMTTELSVRITRDLKRYYLQLLGIRHEDLCVLVNAFDLVAQPNNMVNALTTALPSLCQLVSCDEDELDESDAEEENNGKAQQREQRLDHDDTFSPVQSLDMDSCRQQPEQASSRMVLDDLRRQMGSHDYGEGDAAGEVRDEAEA